jgi:hypothetical protein
LGGSTLQQYIISFNAYRMHIFSAFEHLLYYSYLNASIGFIMDALGAG